VMDSKSKYITGSICIPEYHSGWIQFTLDAHIREIFNNEESREILGQIFRGQNKEGEPMKYSDCLDLMADMARAMGY